MKGLCNGAPFTAKKILPQAGIELGPLGWRSDILGNS